MPYECDSCYDTPCMCHFLSALRDINSEILLLREKIDILEKKIESLEKV